MEVTSRAPAGRLTKDSVVVITGASSDIGLAVTQRFAALGINVIAHYASNPSQLQNLDSPRVHLFQGDLRRDKLARELVEVAVSRHGRIDGLINTIGPFAEHDLLATSPEQWRAALDLNLNVAYAVTHFAAPFLNESRGQILNFTYAGVGNMTAWPEAAAYAAAKAGLGVLTKSLAAALAPRGVRVNAISPGWIDFGRFTPEKQRAIEAEVPMRRLGQPGEVVDLAEWIMLHSPEYMTGALIPLAGALEF